MNWQLVQALIVYLLKSPRKMLVQKGYSEMIECSRVERSSIADDIETFLLSSTSARIPAIPAELREMPSISASLILNSFLNSYDVKSVKNIVSIWTRFVSVKNAHC